MSGAALPPLQARDGRCDWLVIGAGIVGLSAGLRLLQAGRQVLVIDRRGIAAEASRGNAGALAWSDILPLASPGVLRQAPKWLFDPLGPLSLPPAYLPRIAPWLWRFWRASRPDRVAASTAAQRSLMALARRETPALLHSIGAAELMHRDGNLHLYETEAQWRASAAGWAARAEAGIEFEHLHGPAAIASRQAGLSSRFAVGSFVQDWQRIEDPAVLAERIAQALVARGGRIAAAEAESLRPSASGIEVSLAGGSRMNATGVVIAAGAWSHRLAASLGDRIPLETERGYNTTLPEGAFDLRCQLTFADHGFVVTRIGRGIRIGGAVELGGLRAPPRWRRSDALLAKAADFLPGLKCAGGTRWMGFRPSLPDSLPVIGAAPADARVIYAFGHGHLGLTQAAATAALVTDLALGRPTGVDLAPLGPQRFRH